MAGLTQLLGSLNALKSYYVTTGPITAAGVPAAPEPRGSATPMKMGGGGAAGRGPDGSEARIFFRG